MRSSRITLGLVVLLAYISLSRPPAEIETYVHGGEVVSSPPVKQKPKWLTPDTPEVEADVQTEPDLPEIPIDATGSPEGLPAGEELRVKSEESDILSLDDNNLLTPSGSSGEESGFLPFVPDDETDDKLVVRYDRRVQVVTSDNCPHCKVMHKGLVYLNSIEPSWTYGPESTNRFQILDEHSSEGRGLLEAHGFPDLPAWIITEEDGTVAVHSGWPRHNPTSPAAVDFLVGLYGHEPYEYRTEVSSPQGNRLGDRLSRHLRGRHVEGFYDATVDVQSILAKFLGGAKKIEVSEGVTLSLDEMPGVSLGMHRDDVRLSFVRGPPIVSYRKGWFHVSTSIPYLDISKAFTKVMVGLKGLPDFPLSLTW